ncbi:hypothetical protein CYY_001777 [Polysphondylium violaceum]|uniref:Ubiquitin carboxyl-terminal hydrolase n=1 Tax=Polysphondylium violaceum TaxID=133409 RepID=A0A8J4Q194_9MYCE|nr:hypothetical protein CYY_001777 [Polysphondylium violaceum]
MTESPGLNNTATDSTSVGSFECISSSSSSFSGKTTAEGQFDSPMTDAAQPSSEQDNSNNTTTPINEDNENNNNKDNEQQPQQQLAKEERDVLVETQKTTQLEEGQKWAILDNGWWAKFAEGEPVGPIDNSLLLIGNNIKPGLSEGNHFTTVPDTVWKKLVQVYGGGPEIMRSVVKNYTNRYQIDLKIPFMLQFMKSSSLQTIVQIPAYKHETISSLKERACKEFQLKPEDVRIWDYYNQNKYSELKDREYVSNSNFIENQHVLLEERLADGSWPAVKQNNHQQFQNTRTGSARPGITGLNNLGNTCFMNSALQCLSNTPPLTNYFLNNTYVQDLNKTNPLGCNGDLATDYASLIKDIWAGTLNSVAPRDFKSQIERFAPQFAGYHQHDSQELLAFLLDGLHEDLNKVLKKPFIEGKDYDGRPDDVIAKEQWQMHKARNDSIIIDWFQAQLKSKLVCPVCSKISITFDPFMYLSLPLPSQTQKQFNVVFINKDSKIKATTHEVCLIAQTSTGKDILEKISEQVSIPTKNLVLCTFSHMSSSFKIVDPKQGLDNINNRDSVIVYEVETDDEQNPLVVYQQVVVNMKQQDSYYSSRSPFILSVPSTVKTTGDLYKVILDRLDAYLNRAQIDEIFNSHSVEQEEEEEQEDNENDGEKPEKQEHDSEKAVETNASASNADSVSEDDTTTPMIGPLAPSHMSSGSGYFHSSNGYNHSSYASSRSGMDYNSYGYNSNNRNVIPADKKDPRFVFQILDSTKNLMTSIPTTKIGEITLILDNGNMIDTDPLNQAFSRTHPHREVPVEREVSLKRCIELFITEEQLGPDDPWYCSTCKEHQRAFKKFDIWSAPPILVVHLKRFSYKKYNREKLDTLVKFPIEDLDLSEFVLDKSSPKPVYDLFAVSNHYGSMGGGHYTAYAKNHTENKWFKFDDSHVSEVHDPNNVETEAAYVLFYRRRDTAAPATTAEDVTMDLKVNSESSLENDDSNNNLNNTTTTTTTTTTNI